MLKSTESKQKDTTYTLMKSTTRLNYRSSCDLTANTIVGVLEENTIVSVADDFREFACGHFWNKIKVGRKHYYAIADWLLNNN